MNSITIRPMGVDDWRLHRSIRLAALADAPYAFTTTLQSVQDRSDEEWAEVTRQRVGNPDGVTYFAFAGEVPCGMAACVVETGVAEMLSVWVSPASRRRGVGLALVAFAREWARAHAARALEISVYEDNPGAREFYRTCGFVETGERKTEADRRVTLTMRLDL